MWTWRSLGTAWSLQAQGQPFHIEKKFIVILLINVTPINLIKKFFVKVFLHISFPDLLGQDSPL